ncbi:MAG: hypothetical protein V2A71_10305, partial [Candidatus Eisenbacteria bacterium]
MSGKGSRTGSLPTLLDDFMRREGSRVEHELDCVLPSPRTRPVSVHRAMRYAVLRGGKRIRP